MLKPKTIHKPPQKKLTFEQLIKNLEKIREYIKEIDGNIPLVRQIIDAMYQHITDIHVTLEQLLEQVDQTVLQQVPQKTIVPPTGHIDIPIETYTKIISTLVQDANELLKLIVEIPKKISDAEIIKIVDEHERYFGIVMEIRETLNTTCEQLLLINKLRYIPEKVIKSIAELDANIGKAPAHGTDGTGKRLQLSRSLHYRELSLKKLNPELLFSNYIIDDVGSYVNNCFFFSLAIAAKRTKHLAKIASIFGVSSQIVADINTQNDKLNTQDSGKYRFAMTLRKLLNNNKYIVDKYIDLIFVYFDPAAYEISEFDYILTYMKKTRKANQTETIYDKILRYVQWRNSISLDKTNDLISDGNKRPSGEDYFAYLQRCSKDKKYAKNFSGTIRTDISDINESIRTYLRTSYVVDMVNGADQVTGIEIGYFLGRIEKECGVVCCILQQAGNKLIYKNRNPSKSCGLFIFYNGVNHYQTLIARQTGGSFNNLDDLYYKKYLKYKQKYIQLKNML